MGIGPRPPPIRPSRQIVTGWADGEIRGLGEWVVSWSCSADPQGVCVDLYRNLIIPISVYEPLTVSISVYEPLTVPIEIGSGAY